MKWTYPSQLAFQFKNRPGSSFAEPPTIRSLFVLFKWNPSWTATPGPAGKIPWALVNPTSTALGLTGDLPCQECHPCSIFPNVSRIFGPAVPFSHSPILPKPKAWRRGAVVWKMSHRTLLKGSRSSLASCRFMEWLAHAKALRTHPSIPFMSLTPW